MLPDSYLAGPELTGARMQTRYSMEVQSLKNGLGKKRLSTRQGRVDK